MKQSTTKKSLTLSAWALFISILMLVGTTFAWFTDSVTSGKNIIKAGNLDIELEYYDTETSSWEPVTENVSLFDDNALWEPGYTEVAYLRLSNQGSLALKYNFAINVFSEKAGTNVAGESFKLSDYIHMGVDDTWDGTVYADRAAARAAVSDAGKISTTTKEGKMLPGEETAKIFAIVVYMPEEVGNEANYKTGTEAPTIEMGINLVATQDTVEADSFDNKYDLSANLPVVASFPSIKEADLNGDDTVEITEKGAIKSAVVPARGTAGVFNELKKEGPGYSNDLTLTLSVNETGTKEKEVEGGKEKTIDLDINMSAVMTSTLISTGEVTTKKKEKVDSLTEFTTIEMNIGKEYDKVSVLHKGVAMQKLSSASDTPTDTTNGGYFYDDSTGILTLKTMTFSPFTVKTTKSNMPKKGTLIKMDLVPSGTTVYPVEACPIGDDGKETYRILKTEGQTALVLAMYDAEKGLEFASSATKATFSDNSQYLKYEGSKVDIALNTTFYGKLSQNAKSAIVTKSIDQSAYEKWYGTIAGTTYTDNKINADADIKFTCKGSGGSNELLGAEYKAKVSVGERNVFALDLSEIDEYFAKGSEAISADELFELFYHMTWNENLNDTMPNPKLRTGSANETSYAWFLSGTTSFAGPLTAGYNMTGYGFWGDFPHSARPAFYIDLSKIDWSK